MEEKIKVALEYLTNEHNFEYKYQEEINKSIAKIITDLQQQNKELQDRIDKAIELAKPNTMPKSISANDIKINKIKELDCGTIFNLYEELKLKLLSILDKKGE